MASYKSMGKGAFPKGYLHSFSQGMSAAYVHSVDAMESACRYSGKLLGRMKLPLAVASIPIGIALAASRYNCLEQIGYTTIGGGFIELLVEARSKKVQKRQERLRRREIKRIREIEVENEELKMGLERLNKRLRNIERLERKEIEILTGKP